MRSPTGYYDHAGALDAYSEVLAAILDGEAMIGARDAAEECWRYPDQVLEAYRTSTLDEEIRLIRLPVVLRKEVALLGK